MNILTKTSLFQLSKTNQKYSSLTFKTPGKEEMDSTIEQIKDLYIRIEKVPSWAYVNSDLHLSAHISKKFKIAVQSTGINQFFGLAILTYVVLWIRSFFEQN